MVNGDPDPRLAPYVREYFGAPGTAHAACSTGGSAGAKLQPSPSTRLPCYTPPDLVRTWTPGSPIWSPKSKPRPVQERGAARRGGSLPVEAAGIEPTDKAMENPRQDTLLRAIALSSRRFVVPPYLLRLLERRGVLPAQGPEDARQAYQARSLRQRLRWAERLKRAEEGRLREPGV